MSIDDYTNENRDKIVSGKGDSEAPTQQPEVPDTSLTDDEESGEVEQTQSEMTADEEAEVEAPTPPADETIAQPVAIEFTQDLDSAAQSAVPVPEVGVVAEEQLRVGGGFFGRLLSTNAGRVGLGVVAAALVMAVLFGTHVICFHEWSEPTCTEPSICSICGRTKGEALGHDWQEATCTEAKTCQRCHETEGKALGHSVTKWAVTTKATCTKAGVESAECDRCGEVQTRELPMVAHEFGDWKTTKQATCTEKGERTRKCKNCDKTETEALDMIEHAFGDWETTKAATCTSEGESVRKCTKCGKTETKTIPKTDHTPSDWKVVKDVSVTSSGDVIDGKQARVCTVCGAELESKPYTISVSTSQKNALRTAASYLSFTAFSHEGLVHQLEFEGYSNEDATFAADHCGADWREQAQKSAESYLSYTSFSHDGLVHQLEYEGFSTEDAVYAADNCGADWNEQAAKSAESYLNFTGFSRDGLIDQLMYEGFTYDQAAYGADSVGL